MFISNLKHAGVAGLALLDMKFVDFCLHLIALTYCKAMGLKWFPNQVLLK